MSLAAPLTGEALVRFHEGAPAPGTAAPWDAIAENHRCNAALWEEEDLARRTDAPDAEIVANKRAIDRLNQRRNDAVERIDEALLASLPPMDPRSRLHSETPGAMVDRLSILSLKIRAMGAQAERADAGEAHRAACRDRLARLLGQREDLAACLDDLLRECAAGSARFKAYRQFKMYNDPALNPHLAAKRGG